MEARNLLEIHQTWTRELEAPSRFHNFSFLACFAHAVGRRVFLPFESGIIYPGHLMVLLLGESGIRKTTAAAMPLGCLTEARDRIADKTRINVMAERMSTEAMIDDLIPLDEDEHRVESGDADCAGLLPALEMAATFGSAKYMEDMAPLVTRLADASSGHYDPATESVAPYYYKKNFKKDGIRHYRNPTLTLLAATTPDSMGEDLPPQIRKTGFLARLLTVFERRSDRPPNPLLDPPTDEDYANREALIVGFARATELRGAATLDEEASAWLRDWYMKRLIPAQIRASDDVVRGFLNRAQAHLLRLALLLAAIEVCSVELRGIRIVVRLRHVQPAEKMVMRIARDLPDAFGAVGYTQLDRTKNFVYNYMKRHESASRHAIQIAAHKKQIRTGTLEPTLRTLLEDGTLTVTKTGQMKEWLYAFARQTAGPLSGRPATRDEAGTEYWDLCFGTIDGTPITGVYSDDELLSREERARLARERYRREHRAMNQAARLERRLFFKDPERKAEWRQMEREERHIRHERRRLTRKKD